jgi:DNA polymerase (family 10)
MLKIAGLGPKRVQSLYEEPEITSLQELEQSAREGRIRDVEGFGPKTEQNIIEELERRRQETVVDIDVTVIGTEAEQIAKRFTEYEDVDEIVSRGETRSTAIFRSGLQVDLRVVHRESYGAALLYFTGSKSHNIALRTVALDHDWKVNEYGMFEGNERIAGETEEEIYDLLRSPTDALWRLPGASRLDRGRRRAQHPQLVRTHKAPRAVTVTRF